MQKSAWRFFPAAVAAALLTVFAVNGAMIWSAVYSFPGSVDDHAFETGNKYNEILAEAARQAALGWQLNVKVISRDVEVTLTDKNGSALSAAAVQAIATHPLGPATPANLGFTTDGVKYVSTSPLPSSGQWDLGLTAVVGEIQYRVTRRIIVQ